MSGRLLLSGNAAAAWGARLARVDYVPAFPITPQTEILETLGRWIEAGELDARLVLLESEHSMVTAAAAAAATGVRAFTATSSQGLLYAMEMVFAVPGWRAPFVLVNVSRGLATPITLEPDHTDVLAARDAGFLQLHCATAQEVLDTVLIAHRLGEDPRVRLPVLVNFDGFHVSFTREPVALPDPAAVDRFLPPYDPAPLGFRASRPLAEATAVLGSAAYSYFRYETHLAARGALAVHDEVAASFSEHCGRAWPAVETHRTDDAEVAFVVIGSLAMRAREAVDRLRDAGVRVGLVRPRLIRPWPAEALRGALRGVTGVAVLDQNLSMGSGGVLHAELAATLFGAADAPRTCASFIGGLGGRSVSLAEFAAIADETVRAARAGVGLPPRLLYSAGELREVRKLQGIARAEREALAPGGPR